MFVIFYICEHVQSMVAIGRFKGLFLQGPNNHQSTVLLVSRRWGLENRNHTHIIWVVQPLHTGLMGRVSAYTYFIATSSKMYNNSWNGFFIFSKGVICPISIHFLLCEFNASMKLFGSFTLHDVQLHRGCMVYRSIVWTSF